MKLFSLAIFLAFVARSVLSDVSWARTDLVMDDTAVTPSSYEDMMVMKRGEAPGDRELTTDEVRKGVKAAVAKGSGAKGGGVKGAKGFKQSKLKGSKKGNYGKGAKKGGKKNKKGGKKGNTGDTGGPVVERKCSIAQNSLSFTLLPDTENVIGDINGPAIGLLIFFGGDDFVGLQTQTILFLAGGAIATGQDSFEFFVIEGEELVGVGTITTQFGNGLPVITGGTGIFLGAVGGPVLSTDNDGNVQLLFDICVNAL
jgi:hypothetical protein